MENNLHIPNSVIFHFGTNDLKEGQTPEEAMEGKEAIAYWVGNYPNAILRSIPKQFVILALFIVLQQNMDHTVL